MEETGGGGREREICHINPGKTYLLCLLNKTLFSNLIYQIEVCWLCNYIKLPF